MIVDRITNVAHVPRVRALLDSPAMVRHPVAVFERYRAALGATFSFHFGGATPAVASTDPAVIEHVLRVNRDNYRKSSIQVERMVEFQGVGLVNSHGAAWLRQRRLLAHGFRPAHLARLLPLQQDVLAGLLEEFDAEARRGPVDVHRQMVRFTLRLVGNALFGRRMTQVELDRIGGTIAAIQAFIVREIVQPYRIPWFQLTGEAERHQRLRREADALVLRHIRARLDEPGTGADFLRILIETPYGDTGERMSEEQVVIESLQLMVAGNETSSNALTWILHLLGTHREQQQAVREEVASVIGDAAIDYRNLHALEHTLRVVDESLRLYPPFWMIDRVALADDEVAGLRIPAGAMVIPYIYGTHRNPAYWDDAERFDPGRFDPARAKARHPFAYIPFGGGPRTCIGNSMAIMQILLILAVFVRRYDFTADAPAATGPMMLLRPAGPVPMTFRARA